MNRALPYPPPFQDLRTLSAHVCMSEGTIEELLKNGRFPPPRRNKCGKRLWVWREVEEFLAAPDNGDAVRGGLSETVRKITGG